MEGESACIAQHQQQSHLPSGTDCDVFTKVKPPLKMSIQPASGKRKKITLIIMLQFF